MITPEQLEEWERLSEAATPGPWKKSAGEPPWYMGDETVFCNTPNLRVLLQLNVNFDCKNDALFIAAAREAVPALLAELARLNARITELETEKRNKVNGIDSWGFPR